MRHSIFLKAITSLLLLLIALPSSATIIVEGNLKAKIYEYHQSAGDHSDFGSPEVGTEVFASFAYSVEKNITGPVEEPNLMNYQLNWMRAEFNIGGVHFNVPPTASAEASSQLSVQKRTKNSWIDFEDMFSLMQRYAVKESSPWAPSHVDRSADILLWGGIDDIGAAQDFSFTNGADFPAYLYLQSKGYDSNSNYYYEALSANIVDFSIASRTADVAEPKVWILYGMGLLFLIWRKFRHSTSV